MKKLCAFVCFLVSLNVCGQSAIISTTQTRVFYVGIENTFEVSVPGKDSTGLVVKSLDTSKCTILKVSASRYMARVNPSITSCRLLIGIRNKQQIKWLDSVSIAVRPVPKGYVGLGTLGNSTYAPLADIMKQDRLIYYNDAYISWLANARVIKYQMIILPRKGMMEQISIRGDSIPNSVKKMLETLQVGDMILFEGIRVNMTGNGTSFERAFAPFIMVVRDHLLPFPSNGHFRITGFFRNGLRLDPYLFPADANSVNKEELLVKQKDSIWSYYTYEQRYLKYMLFRKDSFYKSRFICSYFYNDSNSALSYRLEKADDSIWRYTSYHPNGQIYQEGLVMNNVRTNNKHRVYKRSSFYENKNYPVKKTIWEQALADIHDEWCPIFSWRVYDSLGHLYFTIQYTSVPDLLNPKSTIECAITCYNYVICADGELVFYEQDGKIARKIWLKEGKEVKK